MINTIENTVGGTDKDGRIVLDRPMDWAEGVRVVVHLHDKQEGLITGVWPDDGSVEGDAEIIRRSEEPMPPELQPTLEEMEDFADSIEEVRNYHRKTDSRP